MVDEFLKQVLKDVISSKKRVPNGTFMVKFGNSGFKKYRPSLMTSIQFETELYDELIDLVNNESWALYLYPHQIEDVEGVATIKLKIDLSLKTEMAKYIGHEMDQSLTIEDWIKYNEELPQLKDFRFLRWGDSFERAKQNIYKARSMLAKQPLSIQQLSARIFGDAKQLDYVDLNQITTAFPELLENVRTRRVILNYTCFGNPKKVLIVENMDTYHYLRNLVPAHWMLVYGAGNKISKSGVLDLAVADLHAGHGISENIHQQCCLFWANFDQIKYYWGDKGSEGEQIFQSLKEQIPRLVKWLPAYEAMDKLTNKELHQEAVLINDMINPFDEV